MLRFLHVSTLCLGYVVAGPTGADIVDLRVTGDAYVRGGAYATRAFGREDLLEVKARDVEEFARRAFLKVDIASLDAAESAHLYLFGSTSEGAAILQASRTSTGWSESSLTWKGQPDPLATEGLTAIFTNKGWVALDVTDSVTAALAESADRVAFVITETEADDNALVRLYAREHASGNAPFVRVVRNEGPTSSVPGVSVSAGPDQAVEMPDPLSLFASVEAGGGAATGAAVQWTMAQGPDPVVFSAPASPATAAWFSAPGTYRLRFRWTSAQGTAEDTMTAHVLAPGWGGPTVPPCPAGIWISPSRIRQLPMAGEAWENLLETAHQPAGTPDLSDQHETANLRVLAKALVFVRTGIAAYRDQVRAALGVIADQDTEAGGQTLALGRKLAAYVIAADLIDLTSADPALDQRFRAKLRALLNRELDGQTLRTTHEHRPNNWGTMAGASRAAVAVYLGDAEELERCAQVFHGYLGNRAAYASFVYDEDQSWQHDRLAPVPVNPVGGVIQGWPVDGALPEEMRRGGPFQWPPAPTGYAWEALQGALVQAEILARAGYPAWQWEHGALRRAASFLYAIGWEAAGDDAWQVWLLNHAYGSDWPVDADGVSMGKIMGWTDWTHAGFRGDQPDPCTVVHDVPAYWLQQCGLDPSDEAARADQDRDGFATWQEYLAGTNPTDAMSYFRLDTVSDLANTLHLAWPSVPDRSYSVLMSTNLADGTFQVIAPSIASTPPTNRWPISNPGLFANFRVGIRLLPVLP